MQCDENNIQEQKSEVISRISRCDIKKGDVQTFFDIINLPKVSEKRPFNIFLAKDPKLEVDETGKKVKALKPLA